MVPPGIDQTIGGALRTATAQLRETGIDTPRLDAEVLLGHLLGISRTQLLISTDDLLPLERLRAFEEAVGRRRSGQPVAYLVGSKEFMGRDFEVGPGVLVPRPETEQLVERAADAIRRLWPVGPVRVIDVCTGSGAIALSLALETDPNRVAITGSDISNEALAYARRNRADLGLDGRVSLVLGDLLSWSEGPWDMILSNPPYLRPEQIEENLDLEAEPRLALDGGRSGLEAIERILDQAMTKVASTFAIVVEIDPDQALSVEAVARARFPGADVIILPDLTGRARFVSIEQEEPRT